jgi:hypothetical protein
MVLTFRDWQVDRNLASSHLMEDTEWAWRGNRTTPTEW